MTQEGRSKHTQKCCQGHAYRGVSHTDHECTHRFSIYQLGSLLGCKWQRAPHPELDAPRAGVGTCSSEDCTCCTRAAKLETCRARSCTQRITGLQKATLTLNLTDFAACAGYGRVRARVQTCCTSHVPTPARESAAPAPSRHDFYTLSPCVFILCCPPFAPRAARAKRPAFEVYMGCNAFFRAPSWKYVRGQGMGEEWCPAMEGDTWWVRHGPSGPLSCARPRRTHHAYITGLPSFVKGVG